MALKQILLISEKHIKSYSVIEHNTDANILSKVVFNVQETQLKPILGKKLYNDVLDAVNENITNATTIPDSLKELLDDYVAPFLTFATLADFIIINNFKISNKGVLKANDNSATSLSQQELDYVKNYYGNYLSTYKSTLIQYLKDNKLIDPVTTTTDTDITSISIGWFLESLHQ